MRTLFALYGLTSAFALLPIAADAASLQDAAAALGADSAKSLEFSGAGHWYQFGQAPVPGGAWPQFEVSNYSASVNFDAPAARVLLTRIQTVEPGRRRPTPTEQKLSWFVSADKAWNVAPPQGSPDAAPVATPQAAAVEERLVEIWTTPQGFLKAALANGAKSETSGAGVQISFAASGHKYEGFINSANQIEWARSWIDSPVLGDTLVETKFSGYKDFGGVQFPAELTRIQGGYPVLHLKVAAAKLNPGVEIPVPENIAAFKASAPTVTANKLADGVYWLNGGTHHSVAIEQKDHVVLVEAPLNEDRSLALIAKIAEIAPNKPIRYVVNSHVHFDHSGGLRTFVDAGATIVTHELDKPYYEKAWAAPHTLRPDRLSQSKKAAIFETYADKYTLSDGLRQIEVHRIAGNGHSDELALVYLPAEKILVEADAFTPTAKDAPLPKSPNPYSVNLYENIQKLKLDVAQIVGLHGPRVVALADLRAAIGQPVLAQ
ncbi:MBL fold metallo-hydrolase [Methylocystis parvus]|uniref:MBL fold metallo-hydrolase n=1 Tax=Methylocystis parvus TaxID=134 RepID=A0A6B8M5K4_9HYPH|nr:MBL fold metallo-hydrolase [Methylocystis parvus]QGM97402.1 MBL fold metallo-hydrolase [Methylocystis parvus]WBJ98685.1 MBL fold metallo-hydrolase [Methylocystis parvus OBBP]